MKYGRARNKETSETEKRTLKTKPLLLIIGVLFICNLLWFIGWIKPDKSWKTGEEVASVNGVAISREAWMTAMEKEVGRETLLGLVNDQVMEAAAKAYGIKVSDKEINLELALIHSVDKQAYTGLDAEEERKKIRAALILEKVLTKDVVIDDKQIKANYNDNNALYNIETAYRTAIIVLPTKEEAHQAARELKDGSNFNVLAKERSTDAASASLGGDIGYVNNALENIDQAIVEAASKTKEASTSKPVLLADGTYAIVSVSNIIKGKSFKFKEVKDTIKREIALEQLSESVSPEAFWKEFDAQWFYGD